jgi:RNA polymerase sigma-70 factor (ECF subfamily)
MNSRSIAPAQGLEQVFLSHRPQLLRFLRARGAGEQAEDLLQEVWMRIIATDPGPLSNPLAYIHRVANNLMLDARRAEQRGAQRDLAWHEARTGGTGEPADEATGERALIAREELRQIETELAVAGDRVEKVFRRYRLDNVSQRDIALELGISLSSVEKDLQRAYRVLLEVRKRHNAD